MTNYAEVSRSSIISLTDMKKVSHSVSLGTQWFKINII